MPTDNVVDQSAPALAISRRKMSGKSLAGICIAVAIGLGAAGYGWHWWSAGRFIEDTDDAYVGGDVTVIGAKVPGYIFKVAVTDNQAVHAGDLLVKLDDRDYRAALAKAEGAVAAQQALLENLDATRSLQEAVIAQSKASILATAAESTRAKEDEQRYRNLAGKAVVSVQSEQKADAVYAEALANGQKAQAALVATQRELNVIDSRKQEVQAALAQAIAERDLARLNLEYTELRAPVDGVVGNRHARAGAYAAAGTQLLAVVPAHGLWVDANFKESQLANLRPGQSASIEADVMPGHRFHGHVVSLAPATGAQFSVLPPENATGNFTKIVQRVPVRILLDESDGTLGTLRPGLSVVAEIDSRSSSSSFSRNFAGNQP